MTQLLTGRTSTVAKRIQTLLETKIGDALFSDPPIAGVSYGDQIKVPQVPWLCVEPSRKERQWPPTPTDMTEIDHEVTIYLYHTNITDGIEAARFECDVISETVEEFFNINHRQLRDVNGNDLVIYGYIVSVEHGYSYKGNSLYHASRLTWRGKVKVALRVAQ